MFEEELQLRRNSEIHLRIEFIKKKKKKTLIIKKERNRISSQNRILAAFGESLWMC